MIHESVGRLGIKAWLSGDAGLVELMPQTRASVGNVRRYQQTKRNRMHVGVGWFSDIRIFRFGYCFALSARVFVSFELIS